MRVPPALRCLAVLLAGSSVAVTAACSNPVSLTADTAVHTDTLAGFALTGTPLGYPTGLDTFLRSLVRVDPSFAFDIAFDIDAQGRAVILPVRLVGGTATTSRTVGLLKSTQPFDQMLRAPASGYAYDSVLVLKPGEATFVQAQSASCAVFVSPYIYSKLAVDSVVPPLRVIYFRLVQDPNCGFRSLAPGIPKN